MPKYGEGGLGTMGEGRIKNVEKESGYELSNYGM